MPKYLDMHGLETLTGDIEATYLRKNKRGAANGVASLNSSGKVPSSQLPDTGTSDYSDLTNKPQINGTTLSGNKTSANLGIHDIPSGGTQGQILAKHSATDYDVEWATPADPTSVIDDNAGPFSTDKTFSSSKLWSELGGKVDKTGAQFNDVSMNRVPNSTVGTQSIAIGTAQNAEQGAVASGDNSVAVGTYVQATGDKAIAIGYGMNATGTNSIAIGGTGQATGDYAVAIGSSVGATGYASFAHGSSVTASGGYAHAEGSGTTASESAAHAEGYSATASGTASHAEGNSTQASGQAAHAEGRYASASGSAAHAEGNYTTASSSYTHAEGNHTSATGSNAHSEGDYTEAKGAASHAEGRGTIADGNCQHVSGAYNIPDGISIFDEWVAGTKYHVGDKVKVTGEYYVSGYVCVEDNDDEEFDYSKWDNLQGQTDNLVIIGNGTSNERSNAYCLDWEGNGHYAGDVYVGCNADGSGGVKLEPVVFATDAHTREIFATV